MNVTALGIRARMVFVSAILLLASACTRPPADTTASDQTNAPEAEQTPASAPAEDGEWHLTWSDEFDGTRLNDAKWSVLKATYSNGEQSYYAAEHTTVGNGVLTLHARKGRNPDGKQYVSGAVSSRGRFAQTYGRFEARMKLPTGRGYWPAFWLLPEDTISHGPWPACGEIDILETGGDTNAYCGTLHFGGKNNQRVSRGIGSVKLPGGGRCDEFHVYAIEWEPKEMRWYCDGALMGTITDWSTYGPHGQVQQPLPAPYDKDFYIIMNLAVGGHFVGNALPEDDNARADMVIDYVRVYSKNEYAMPEQPTTERTVRHLEPAGTNMLRQGSFERSSPTLWTRGGRHIADPTTEDGALAVHIRQDVREQHLQLISYTEPIVMKKDATYRLSFRARSSVACKHIRPVIERPDANWAKVFLYSSLELTREMKAFSFDFTATHSDTNARLLFYTGLMDGDVGGGEHTIYIDDIRLEELVEHAHDDGA